jgi:DNA-binding transcriptional ArsR family regulator/AcrR family transcriptional regulator
VATPDIALEPDTLATVPAMPIVVQPGTGYDLLLSGPLIADRSTDQRITGAAEIRRLAVSTDGGALVHSFEKIGRDPFISLLGFAHARTESPTAANVVTALREADAIDVVLTMVGYYRRAYRVATPPNVIREAVDGDREAIRELLRTSYPGVGHWQASLRNAIGRDPGEVRDELVAALTAWLDGGFAKLETEIEAAQRADAERVRELVATRDLDDILQQISPGITFAREVGQSLVILAPSVLIHPSWAMTDFGSNLVIVYPAVPGRVRAGEPPARLVLLAKALGDELRLRALRELSGGPLSASELARRLGVPRTSLQHHIAILVNAGIARVATDDAAWGRLQLRPEAIAELAAMADGWILEGGAGSADHPSAGGSI